ncbi:Dyp-type peroxidase [Xylanimonas protaetiae]|uniref:Dyp-type peroxidase n=2 Tax=Xylanimonas protaetiae TaxID=2509457 RepID=A0A4P6F8C4_9MICO|nr:Dyp-type peroxidase [Xylanimonas protaetiae]
MTGGCPAHVGRRGFLRGVVGAAGALGLGAVASGAAAAPHASPLHASASTESQGSTEPPGSEHTGATHGHVPAVVPFHGPHQAGITTPAQRAAAFLALDVVVATRDELAQTFQTLTAAARLLAGGGVAPAAGPGAPPSDNGILGVVPTPKDTDGLTVTVSVGASLFDDRFGLAAGKPARLRVMDTFPDDDLDRATCDGDLLLQVCADERDTVLHAVRELLRATRGALALRWRQDGFLPPARPSGAPRNLLGFKDGTVNPPTASADAMADVVWTTAGPTTPLDDQAARAFGMRPDDLPDAVEPAWAAGGSYHVVRTTRMFVEFWDRVTLDEQEQMIGRRRDTGAPLTGSHEDDVPDYAADPTGDAIKLDAHIRLAGPRTPGSEAMRMLRRPYSYDNGSDASGTLDVGLVFVCFVQDLDRQFVAVQNRLAGEPLVDYVSPVGGGYFFALPGVLAADDWYASGLLA